MYKIIVFYATPINNEPNQQQCLVDVANIMATRPLDGKKVKYHADIVGMICRCMHGTSKLHPIMVSKNLYVGIKIVIPVKH